MVRRPSDMVSDYFHCVRRVIGLGHLSRPLSQNEYSKQIKEFRAQEKPGKAHGKVFVKGSGIP
jgi:hypothetical protein